GTPAPYRASLRYAGWPVEMFVHTEATWHAYVEQELRKRRSPLLWMCADGLMLRTAEAAPDWATTLPGFRPCERAELPAGFTAGYRFTVPLIDMPTYLDYLLRRLRDAGGVVEQRRLTSLSDVGPASVIVNCAGLGARDLVPDPDLRPIRGQHVVVTNPGLTEFFSEDTGLSPDLLCFYPHGDTVVLGGTAIDGEGDLAPDDKAAAGILARCAEVEPRLAEARVLEHRIGARPT